MFKCLIMVFLFLNVSLSYGATSVMFAKKNTKATVMMLAVQENPDAIAFNEALNFPAEDLNGKWTKKINFADSQGVELLSAVCVFSKLVSSTGSCSVVFHQAQQAVIDSVAKTIRLTLTGDDANRMSLFFIPAQLNGEVFHSEDNKFVVAIKSLPDGKIAEMRFEYKN